MRIIYHRRIQGDLRDALSYYDGEGGKKLGDRFFAEVERAAARVIENPQGYHFVASGLRRAQLDAFRTTSYLKRTLRKCGFSS